MVPNQKSKEAVAQVPYCFWSKSLLLHGWNKWEHCHSEAATSSLSTCLAVFFAQHQGNVKSFLLIVWPSNAYFQCTMPQELKKQVSIIFTFLITSLFWLVD